MDAPREQERFGLTGETAAQEIGKFEHMMRLAADSAAVYGKWREIVRDYQVTGVQVHDARLVAAMLVHGIPNILALNAADFARYARIITPVHPGSLERPKRR